jgi:hypothetical protein
MTHADVEAILGPPGNYQTGPFAYGPEVHLSECLLPRGEAIRSTADRQCWVGVSTGIDIIFDDSGQAVFKGRDTFVRLEQSPLGNLRWRAERQWRRWFPGKQSPRASGVPDGRISPAGRFILGGARFTLGRRFIHKAPPPVILASMGERMELDERQPIARVPFTDDTARSNVRKPERPPVRR